jgi:hypothetical protein
MAATSINCDLQHGALSGLPQLEPIKDFSGVGAPWPVRKAYRFPDPTNTGQPDAWLPLSSEFASVVRSPLANDTMHRIYWTEPPGAPNQGAWWTTYNDIIAGGPAAGHPPWSLGFIPVDPSVALTVTVTGGDTTVPQIGRSYLITYIDQFNQESSPSAPSPVAEGAPDGTWTVNGLPTAPPASPAGKNYPPVVKMRLYRTITGTSGSVLYYEVTDIPFGSSTYVDTIPDTAIVNNNLLPSADWNPPPDGLDGLTEMVTGMLIGFTGTTVHFCEQDRPNAWPAAYDQTLFYQIMGLAIWQTSLIVLTKGFPSTGSGSTPSGFSFQQIQAPEPCIARGSIVTDLAGVYYASSNGLIMLNYFGMQNQTLTTIARQQWLTEYNAASIIACRHRAQYLAVIDGGAGFLIDYTEQRMGVTKTLPMGMATAIWNDVYTGDAYVMLNQAVFRWDSVTTSPMVYRWRSKEFYMPAPVSLGACQISADPSIADPPPPLSIANPEQPPLPPGINALFRLFVGPAGKTQILEQYLYNAREIFRLPSGRKAFNWQFEIVARVPIHSVELASTMRELQKA